MKPWILSALILILLSESQAAVTKIVRVDFIEALAPKDTTSSERFQKDYEGAIQLGESLIAKKISGCGYTLETKASFYESGDSLKAKELAEQARKNSSWLIVGPRRSNQYLLLVQGADPTPSVSLMASSDEVSKLSPRHVSVSPSNTQMANMAAAEVKARKGKATYLTVVNDDCSNCVNFSKAFDLEAKRLGHKKLTELKILGEGFAVEPILEANAKHKPTFILIPNYSIEANRIMSAFNGQKSPPLFVGGDGWGDNRYGFVRSGQMLESTIRGVTVRGFPPAENELNQFDLGRTVLKEQKQIPFSAANIAILKVIDSLGTMLCKSRPKTKDDFTKVFDRSSVRHLSAPWGVSLYELKSGEILFSKTKAVR